METIEVTGKSLDEATQQAAKKLGVATDQLTVSVVEQSKGLFGRSTVKIRASVESGAAVATQEPEPVMEPQVEAIAEPVAHDVEAEANVTETADEMAFADGAAADEPETQSEIVATQADADFILAKLNALFQSASLDVSPQVGQISGKYVTVEIDGKDSSFLVGKHGEVINALQYLVNIIINQQLHNGVRTTLDCNNYRHRREEALTKLAESIAEQVQQRGEEAVLDALPAFERRIVHKALSEFPGVTTYSEGEEPNRRVVIGPAD